MKRGPCAAATVLAVSIGSVAPPALADSMKSLLGCADVIADEARLACFDRAVLDLSPPRFAGRLSEITPPFTIAGPTRLRYQSDGAIFVLYLRDANGGVVQNLHLGGGGEGRYLIEHPGTYSLHVNGSETWRVWLESQQDDRAGATNINDVEEATNSP